MPPPVTRQRSRPFKFMISDMPVDMLQLCLQYLSVRDLMHLSGLCTALATAVAWARRSHANDEDEHHLFPRISCQNVTLAKDSHLLKCGKALNNMVVCGGGGARLTAARTGSSVRIWTGHSHLTGVHIASPLEVRGDLTLVGCVIEAGASVLAGGTLRLAHCMVLVSQTQRIKVRTNGSLLATNTTVRTAAGIRDAPNPAFHIVVQRGRSLVLRGCTFEGPVCTCLYVSTASSRPTMERLVVTDCLFVGGADPVSGKSLGCGGLTLRLNGSTASGSVEIARNDWRGRNLAITHTAPGSMSDSHYGGAAAPAAHGDAAVLLADYVHLPGEGSERDSLRSRAVTVACTANVFSHGGALLASGAQLHVCAWVDGTQTDQLPSCLSPTGGATISVNDMWSGRLLYRLFYLFGEYRCLDGARMEETDAWARTLMLAPPRQCTGEACAALTIAAQLPRVTSIEVVVPLTRQCSAQLNEWKDGSA